MAKIAVRVRDDASVKLSAGGSARATDYGSLRNLPSLNGTTLKGDLTSEDVGITAEALGVTAQALGITPESVASVIDPEDLGFSTAGAQKVLQMFM